MAQAYRMCDACASRKVLNTASGQCFFVAHAVFVAELALNNVGEDLSVSVWMLAKPRGPLDVVVIDDPKGAEVHIARVIVRCKREMEPRLQPPCAFGMMQRICSIDHRDQQGRGNSVSHRAQRVVTTSEFMLAARTS